MVTIVGTIIQYQCKVIIVRASQLLQPASICYVVLLDICEYIGASFTRKPLAPESGRYFGALVEIPVAPLTISLCQYGSYEYCLKNKCVHFLKVLSLLGRLRQYIYRILADSLVNLALSFLMMNCLPSNKLRTS